MYQVKIRPSRVDLENVMDQLIEKPYIILKDDNLVHKIGMNFKDLRHLKFLIIANDMKTHTTVLLLKRNNHTNPGSVVKIKSRRIVYQFDFIVS